VKSGIFQRLSLILLLGVFAPEGVRAAPQAGDPLASLAAFKAHFRVEVLPCNAERVIREAGGRSDLERELRDYFVSTVRDGLLRIRAINPILIEASLERLARQELKVECGFYGRDTMPEYDPSTRTIYLGGLSPFSPRSTNVIVATNTIFHEFTHFLEWDNMSYEIHANNVGGGLLGSMKTYDVVYACASYAFPDDRRGPFVAEVTPEERAKHLLQACTTCARATPKQWSGTVTYLVRESAVRATCEAALAR
jgi:hypothetical protein